jgi:hypothetical protein
MSACASHKTDCEPERHPIDLKSCGEGVHWAQGHSDSSWTFVLENTGPSGGSIVVRHVRVLVGPGRESGGAFPRRVLAPAYWIASVELCDDGERACYVVWTPVAGEVSIPSGHDIGGFGVEFSDPAMQVNGWQVALPECDVGGMRGGAVSRNAPPNKGMQLTKPSISELCS